MITPTLQLNHTKYKQFKIAAASSSVALVLGGLAFLQPFSLHDNSYAESSSAGMSVNLEPVIQTWVTDLNDDPIDTADIDLDPDGSIATTTVRAHVSTSNVSGYTLTIQSGSDDAKMVHTDSSITSTINPLTGNGTSTNSWKANKNLNNMWGYSINSNDSYLGLPGQSTEASIIDTTDAPNSDNYTSVTFAAKADTSLPAGTYTDTVIFSAIANPSLTPAMQNFTADDCAALPTWSSTEDDITLRDSRDDNEYTVRRLADGNCWMANNLKLENYTLTPADSNVKNSVSIPAATTEASFDSEYWIVVTDGEDYHYNISAAMALNGTSDNIAYAAAGESSICPKNWRLPSTDEYTQVGGASLNPTLTAGLYNTTATPPHTATGMDVWWPLPRAIPEGQQLFSEVDLAHGNISDPKVYIIALANGTNYAISDLHYKSIFGLSVRCVLPAE